MGAKSSDHGPDSRRLIRNHVVNSLVKSFKVARFQLQGKSCRTVQGVHNSFNTGQCHERRHRLRQAWSDALGVAENNFRQLLASYNSGDWKHVSLASDTPTPPKGKSRVSPNPELTDVVVHRKTTKSGENVYRVVLDVPATDESALLDAWKAVITTPELRQEWDPAVEGAHLIEMFDHRTRISKTQFTLGWPAKCVFFPVHFPTPTLNHSQKVQETQLRFPGCTKMLRRS